MLRLKKTGGRRKKKEKPPSLALLWNGGVDTAHALCAHNYLVPPLPSPPSLHLVRNSDADINKGAGGLTRCAWNLSQSHVVLPRASVSIRIVGHPSPHHLSKVTADTLPRVFARLEKRSEMRCIDWRLIFQNKLRDFCRDRSRRLAASRAPPFNFVCSERTFFRVVDEVWGVDVCGMSARRRTTGMEMKAWRAAAAAVVFVCLFVCFRSIFCGSRTSLQNEPPSWFCWSAENLRLQAAFERPKQRVWVKLILSRPPRALAMRPQHAVNKTTNS